MDFQRNRITSVARAAIALLAAALLSSCGGAVGGNGSGSTPSVPGGPLVISPATATLYSDLATTFIVTGGNGTYLVSSSDQAALPVSGTFTGSSFSVVPNPVASDTPVTITVRDTASAAPVSATLTVKPRTISNVVTILPSASQSDACGASICSGGDAEVRVVLTQAGAPLVNRAVRFDVVSGDVRFITSPAGLPETIALSTETLTDNTGTARVRVRVLADATAQTAILQVTDLGSGYVQRMSVTIAPASNAPLNAQPDTITFVGRAANTCATDISADVIVFGGRPPYQISQPGSFLVTPTVVSYSGGRFTVRATGQCSTGSPIAVVDANGATVTVSVTNALSDVEPTPPATPGFAVSPSTGLELTSCNSILNLTLSGGSGDYVAASGHSSIAATTSGNIGSIRRAPVSTKPDLPPPSTTTFPTVDVSFSDGATVRTVKVALKGDANTSDCPP